MTRALVGTSGYSYKEWRGTFYPEDVKPPEMLGHYASRLRAVEINNTFYRMPKRSVLEGWAEQVPEDFSFVLKVTRRITHFKRLKPSAEEELGYVLETSEALGSRRGPFLFQLPPNFKCDFDRLSAFLELLPDGPRAAFEFRHPSWFEDRVLDLLRSRNVALVIADTGSDDDPPVESTADFGYLRLRQPGYDDRRLAEWAERVKAQGWSDAYVFFKHEDEGAGPRMASRFQVLLENTS